MTRLGIDYAWGRPGGAAIKAAGYTFAVRYVDYPGAAGKGLMADELADLHANGVAVALVFESTGNRVLDGQAAGKYDAGMVQSQLTALGWPADRPAYFAVDFGAMPAQMEAIDTYLAGVASVLGQARVGVYGSYAVVSHCRASRSAAWYWQCLAWSSGQMFEDRHIYQTYPPVTVNGVSCDVNQANADDFGQWEALVNKEDEVTQDDFDKMLAASPLAAQITELNAAIVKRFNIIRVAAGTDETGYAAMLKADDALKKEGLVS